MKNIAIVCGGFSGEYEISIQSARVVAENLDKNRYNSYLIVITKNRWYYQDNNGAITDIDKNDFSLPLKDNKVIRFDGVFNAIHGTPGEDGKLLGYFDMLGLPYTSCSADVSALTFNKFLCNKFVSSYGITLAKSATFVKGEAIPYEEIVQNLGMPLFVKPASSGSSVGITKVKNSSELPEAVAIAFKEGDRVIIEEFIDGREIACGLIMKNQELIVFPLTEIISKKEFFDYEAKYTKGMADEITPPVNLELQAELDIKTVSSFLYRQLNCKGFVRIDYIVAKNGIYFIEINTVPGISNASILPQQAAAMGMPIDELFAIAVDAMF
ncbi:MAG: D-alanine--D-alanine ligase [Bacteroidales bacterium]|nr:D-alanine--D-alanine ligase [Bacteroidales bacterium]